MWGDGVQNEKTFYGGGGGEGVWKFLQLHYTCIFLCFFINGSGRKEYSDEKSNNTVQLSVKLSKRVNYVPL